MLLTEFKHPSVTEFLYLDIETYGPKGAANDLASVLPACVKPPLYNGGLSLGLGAIALVSVLSEENTSPEIYHFDKMLDCERRKLIHWMINGSHMLVAHNACFDLAFLLKEALRLGVDLQNPAAVLDTMHLSKVEECLKTSNGSWGNGFPYKHSLAACCARHLELNLDKSQQMADWSNEPTTEMVQYAEQDVMVLRQLLSSKLNAVTEPYMSLLLSEGQAAFDVSLVGARGMHVDQKDLLDAIVRETNNLSQLDQAIRSEIDVKVVTAPAMTRALTNAKVDLLPDAKGNPQCNKLSLNLVKNDHPSIPLYLEYIAKKQEVQSLLSMWTGYDPSTSRVYSLLSSWAAPSGRMSSSKPNLMSLPKPVRSVIASPNPSGHLSVVDLSQIQVRAVAKESGCSALTQEFYQDGDVHRTLAASILQKHPSEVSIEERSSAKPGTFGFIFGGGVETFIRSQIERGNIMSWDDAEKTKSAFSNAFPGVLRWQKNGFREMKVKRGNGKLGHTIGGMPFVAKTGTANLNYPIQAYDALILKLFLSEAHKLGWSVVGLLHDEVVVEDVPVDEVSELLESAGEVVMQFPVLAEGQQQKYWAA